MSNGNKHFTYAHLNGGNLKKLNELADKVYANDGEGSVGPQGDKGDTGDQGIQGDTGPKGAKGDTGATGSDGQSIEQADWDNLVDRVAALESEVHQPSGPE